MRVKLDIQGLSQYNAAVGQEIQNSVCEPVTAHVILNYLNKEETLEPSDIYQLYK